MGYATHIGRIGALAVALGIGSAVIAWPGAALAGPEGAPDSPGAPAAQDGPDTRGAGVESKTPAESDDPGGLGIFRHNPLKKILTGLAGVSADATRGAVVHVAGDAPNPRKRKVPDNSSDSGTVPASSVAGTADGDATDAPSVARQFAAPAPKIPRNFAQPKPVTSAVNAETARSPAPVRTESVSQVGTPTPHVPDVVAAPTRLGLHIVTGVLAAALAPFASPSAPGNLPPAPTLIAVLAFVRREIQHDLFNQRPTLVADTQTTQVDGDAVTGHVTGADADGDTLTYTANGGAEGSTVTVDDHGNWTYTAPPGAVGAEPYSDTFTITASDGSGHLHGLSGLFSPDGGHTATVNVGVSVEPESSGATPPVLNETTGEVTGSVGSAPSGSKVVITDPPKYGTLTIDPNTGNYVYTPNQAGRLKAALAPADQPFTDSFTVDVVSAQPQPMMLARTAAFTTLAADDGTEVTVPVAKSALIAGPDIPVGDSPGGIVMTDKYAYVVNVNPNGTNSTVTVIDIASGAVVGTPLPVGKQSILGASKDGKVYVTSFTDGTISVIDTEDNTLVDVDNNAANGVTPIVVGGNLAQAVADPDPDVHRLYVNSLSGVYVIDTANDTVVDADGDPANGVTPITLAPADGQIGALAFSEDGKRLYGSAFRVLSATSTGFTLDGQVVVIDTDPASADRDTVIETGLAPDTVPSVSAVSGNKLFTTEQPLAHAVIGSGGTTVTYPPGTIHVVDVDPESLTYGEVLYDIPVGANSVYLTTSPDKSLVYVVSVADGSISVIDVAEEDPAKAVLTTFTYNANQPGNGYNLIAVSPDGEHLYVSNLQNDSVSTYTLT